MNRPHRTMVGIASRRPIAAVAWVIFILATLVMSSTTAWAQWTTGSGLIYYNGGNVGIGTASPAKALDLSGSVRATSSITLGSYLIPYDYPGMIISNGSGSGFLFFNRNLSSFSWNQGDLFEWYNPDGTARLWTPGSGDVLTIRNNGNVGIGTTNPGSYKLAVEGVIGARDVTVTNAAWADYVLQPGYRLRPLSEVNAYIQQYRHLPDVPSEAEVKEKGVSVSDIQAKLLAKIEELTLHMIQADERNSRLEQQNQELLQRIGRLENQAAPLPAPVK